MIDMTQVINAGTTTAATNGSEQKDLDKDAFLKLLITQMSNQNPLEPMNNTEFLAQLAQFSSLEQMQNVSSGIEKLAQSQTIATNSQLLNLLGKRVMVPGSEFTQTEGKSVELRFEVPPDSELPAYLRIKDLSGKVIRSIELEDATSGTNTLLFDGLDQSGTSLTSGNYQFDLINQGNEKLSYTTFSNVVIDSVSFETFGILLKSNTSTVNFEEITEIKSNQGDI